MKVTVRTERYYTIMGADGSQQDDWLEASRWNGIVELKRNGKKIIAMHRDEFPGTAFGGLFAEMFGDTNPQEFVVLKGSPDVLKWLGEKA